MKHLTKILLIIFVFMAGILFCHADSLPVKIIDLAFDNSDNVVLLKTIGDINPETMTGNISKGKLINPDRAYIDIKDSILVGPAKTYQLKNSVLDSVKISQFSKEPNIVRIVFSYNNAFNINDFNPLVNKNAIAVKYGKKIVQNQKFHIVYSNTETSLRGVFFEGTKSEIKPDSDIVNVSNNVLSQDRDKNKLQSKFFLNSVSSSKDGIMIKGIGLLSIMPAFYLSNPDRMVIDLDDTILSQNLRNKTFSIGELEVDPQGSVKTRDVIKLGQNSTNITRLVIQGPEAKNYRIVISPDLQNMYIAKKTDIINAKITEIPSYLKKVTVSSDSYSDTIDFNFTDPVAFNVFEENKNLYIDLNNVTLGDLTIFSELVKKYPQFQTVRIALDKTRLVIPTPNEGAATNTSLKITPDAKNLTIVFKDFKDANKEVAQPAVVPSADGKESFISKVKDKFPSMSNMYKVVIDAGHGGTDVGATRAGIYEKNITLSIAKMIEKNLKSKGIQTQMTVDRDVFVPLADRSNISNAYEPDVFVSVHVNSSTNPDVYGIETHYYKDDSVDYAKTIHKYLARNTGLWQTRDRGLFKSKFYVINHTEAPAILCEIGFISNEKERSALTTQQRQMEIAKAITDGIMEYLKARK